MPSLLDNFLKGLGSSSSVKDYAHASRIFVSESFLRSPKFAHMFYVLFDYVQSDARNDGLVTPFSKGLQLGALCKSASLPRYTIENQTLNAYNRANIVQKKLKYDPVTLKFHDDSADIVREFWYDYLSFFYRDTDYEPALYAADHKYADRMKEDWGYGLRTPRVFGDPPADYRPIKAIRIFSFTQGKFSEYMLINPVITAFRHGEHNAEGSTLLEHEMTISYEAVKYYKGYVTEDQFGDSLLLLYDRTPSALTAGSTRSIFGPGGLVGTIDTALADLAQGNFLGAFAKINRATQTFKGVNIGQVLQSEGIEQVSRAVLSGTNPLSTVNAPNIGDVTNNIAGGFRNSNPYLLAAGGGLAVYGATQVLGGSSNSVGPEARVAVSRPATPSTDNTQARIDYRATSGNEIVATGYQAPQRQATFPQIRSADTSTTAAQTAFRVRELANYSVDDLSQEVAARQQYNLNVSQNLVSGSSQGTPTNQPIPVGPNSRVTSDNFGVKFVALYEEIAEFENTYGGQYNDRKKYLANKMLGLLSTPFITNLTNNNDDLTNAIKLYRYEMNQIISGVGLYPPLESNPNQLNLIGVTQADYSDLITGATKRLAAFERLGNAIKNADINQATFIQKYVELASQIQPASEAGDLNKIRQIVNQLQILANEKLALEAFDGILDVRALTNYLKDLLGKQKVTQNDLRSATEFWIT